MKKIIIEKAWRTDLEKLLALEQGITAAERFFYPTLKEEKIQY